MPPLAESIARTILDSMATPSDPTIPPGRFSLHPRPPEELAPQYVHGTSRAAAVRYRLLHDPCDQRGRRRSAERSLRPVAHDRTKVGLRVGSQLDERSHRHPTLDSLDRRGQARRASPRGSSRAAGGRLAPPGKNRSRTPERPQQRREDPVRRPRRRPGPRRSDDPPVEARRSTPAMTSATGKPRPSKPSSNRRNNAVATPWAPRRPEVRTARTLGAGSPETCRICSTISRAARRATVEVPVPETPAIATIHGPRGRGPARRGAGPPRSARARVPARAGKPVVREYLRIRRRHHRLQNNCAL